MKKRKTIAVVSVFLAAALLLFVLLSVAKYTTKKGQQSELTSQNFYFSSNFLKADEVPTYEIYGNTVTFSVRNHLDSLRINATDIQYTVSADVVTLNRSSGSLPGAISSSEVITLSYPFAADELQKEITVSVTGTGDFTQTLKAKFIFMKNDGLRYEMKDRENRDYAEFYLYMGNTAGDVTLTWNKAELLIDETNDYVFGRLNAEKSSVTIPDIPANTTVKIVFFKKNIAQDYTCVMTKSDGTININ